MCDEKIAIRVLLRHYWKKGLSTRAAAEEICAVEGEGVVNKTTAAEWFKRFNEGDTSLQDKPRSGRPSTVDNEALLEAVKNQPATSNRILSAELGPHYSTIDRHLQHLGLHNRRCREIPHDLTPAQAQRRKDICQQLLANPQDARFWKRIVTGDEKWIYLSNPYKDNQWLMPGQPAVPVVRREQFEKKVMLCVWWNLDGVLHFELVPEGHAINASLYSEQLQRVHDVLQTRYPALINRKRALLLHDNASPHTARTTQKKIQELADIEVLPHPPYSPDLAPSDYHLFRSMAHFLRGRQFENVEEVENGCHEFFASKSKEWYRHGIEQLARRWIQTIENDGLYFES